MVLQASLNKKKGEEGINKEKPRGAGGGGETTGAARKERLTARNGKHGNRGINLNGTLGKKAYVISAARPA